MTQIKWGCKETENRWNISHFLKDCPLNFCFDHELECQTHESGYKKVSQHIIYLYNFRYIHHFSLWQLRPTISRKNMNAVTSLSKALQIKSYTPLIKFSGWYNDTFKNTQTSLTCCIKSSSY